MGPPPKFPSGLGGRFAADPFDSRLRVCSPNREHSPLGLIAEALWHLWHGGDPALMEVSFAACLRRVAPDVLADLERMRREYPNEITPACTAPVRRERCGLPPPPRYRGNQREANITNQEQP